MRNAATFGAHSYLCRPGGTPENDLRASDVLHPANDQRDGYAPVADSSQAPVPVSSNRD
ncbi:hypothetical protein HNP40_003974 [Mycobacteroides chelonae]|nr:hypothetical protein [Mycobacteroides chelonae]